MKVLSGIFGRYVYRLQKWRAASKGNQECFINSFFSLRTVEAGKTARVYSQRKILRLLYHA